MSRSALCLLLEGLALSCCTGGRAGPDAAADATVRPARAWTLVVLMPYDNDLDPMADGVLAELSGEPLGAGAAVAVLVDRLGPGGLRRVTLSSEGRRDSEVGGEDSASAEALGEHLEWVRRNLPAERYAVLLLGHGGRLDQISLDLHPGRGGDEPAWGSAAATGEVLRRFAASLPPGALALLVLQQCGRAGLEDLYSFRGTAEALVASETVVGAPNTYYRALLRRLVAAPAASGEDLGRAVLEGDRHSGSLVLLRGAALAELPRRAAAVVEALAPLEGRRLRRPAEQSPSYAYGGDRHFDLCSYSRVLAELSPGSRRADLEEALDQLVGGLVVAHRRRSFPPRPVSPTWCGLSTFVPDGPDALEPFLGLPFYRDSSWARLGRALEPEVVRSGPVEMRSLPLHEAVPAARR